MVHPLVEQLRFARSEFVRGLGGVTAAEAQQRFLPMNCISWNVGHLAWQEQRYWLHRAQSKILLPEVNVQFAYGAQASAPTLDDMWSAWRVITTAADPWLDSISGQTLLSNVMMDDKPTEYIFGSLLQRMIYHYWYHTGENAAIRQQLRHTGLPDFVGDIDHEAPYRPESDA
ncbi:MAG: DinB family protein [Chloroflexota bacterium]|nr:DinB family protein [Chloroflexota bacterium]